MHVRVGQEQINSGYYTWFVYNNYVLSFLSSVQTRTFFFSKHYVLMQHEKSFMELTKLLYLNFEPDDKWAQGDWGRLHAAYTWKFIF